MKFLKNTVKEKLKNNQLVVGSWLQLPCLETAEIIAKTKPDFIVVDLEHSCIGFEMLQKMIIVIEGYDIPPFVRVDQNDPNTIKKVLEMGAYGLIVPMVNSKKEAQKALDSIHYVPRGIRGVGLARAQGYGFDLEKYKTWYPDNIVFIVQIESSEAIKNLQDILSLNEIDATMIGPYDLSASFGHPGDFQQPKMQEALKQYEALSKEHSKSYGYHIVHPSTDLIKNVIEKGYKFIICGSDEIFLSEKSKSEINKVKNIFIDHIHLNNHENKKTLHP